jgi:hypothetical protein
MWMVLTDRLASGAHKLVQLVGRGARDPRVQIVAYVAAMAGLIALTTSPAANCGPNDGSEQYQNCRRALDFLESYGNSRI